MMSNGEQQFLQDCNSKEIEKVTLEVESTFKFGSSIAQKYIHCATSFFR